MENVHFIYLGFVVAMILIISLLVWLELRDIAKDDSSNKNERTSAPSSQSNSDVSNASTYSCSGSDSSSCGGGGE